MTIFFDPQQNTHFEVAEYFSCKDMSALVLAGVSHLQTAVGLIGSPWYPGREWAIRESLSQWHVVEPFCNVVRVWAMGEDLDHGSLGVAGTVISLLEKLTEEDEIPPEVGSSVPSFWSVQQNNAARGRENSAQLTVLIAQLRRQQQVACLEASMRQTAADAGFLVNQLKLKRAMDIRSVEFDELKRVVNQLSKQFPTVT